LFEVSIVVTDAKQKRGKISNRIAWSGRFGGLDGRKGRPDGGRSTIGRNMAECHPRCDVTVERIKAIVGGFVLAAAFAPAPARAQDRPDFDHLAKDTAAAIDKVTKKGSPDDTAVIVSVFEETPGPASLLGIELTKDFDAALRNHARKFHVVSPDDLKELAASHNLPEAALSDPLTLKCSKSDLGLSVFVEGFVEYGPDGVMMKVAAIQFTPRRYIFRGAQKFPISETMHQLMSKRAPFPPPFFTGEKEVWVNPSHPPVPDGEAIAVKPDDDVRRMPQCLSCPPATFSRDAVWARAAGTVLLRVQVSADGFPAQISLVRGFACGLEDKAFDAVKRWRFKPATGPDGTPIAVVVPVEVEFRLY
jgi:TonB family protein